MKTTSTAQPITQATVEHRSWPQAYKAFLTNRHESFYLKVAPIVLLVGSPEIIASNILPVIGEIADVGGVTLAVVVAARTYHAVKQYK